MHTHKQHGQRVLALWGVLGTAPAAGLSPSQAGAARLRSMGGGRCVMKTVADLASKISKKGSLYVVVMPGILRCAVAHQMYST